MKTEEYLWDILKGIIISNERKQKEEKK